MRLRHGRAGRSRGGRCRRTGALGGTGLAIRKRRILRFLCAHLTSKQGCKLPVQASSFRFEVDLEVSVLVSSRSRRTADLDALHYGRMT